MNHILKSLLGIAAICGTGIPGNLNARPGRADLRRRAPLSPIKRGRSLRNYLKYEPPLTPEQWAKEACKP